MFFRNSIAQTDSRSNPSEHVKPFTLIVRSGSRALCIQAAGGVAIGALAPGAVAIGALAIGRLTVGRARIRHLEINELTVRRLRVTDTADMPR